MAAIFGGNDDIGWFEWSAPTGIKFDKIKFFNDNYKTIKPEVKDWNIWNSESWWFPVKTGDIILFPSSLTHMVETKDIPDIGEIEFSEELLLEHNYIVLYFDNAMDWEVAQEVYGLNKVKSKESSLGSQKIGIGRVLNGKNFI